MVITFLSLGEQALTLCMSCSSSVSAWPGSLGLGPVPLRLPHPREKISYVSRSRMVSFLLPSSWTLMAVDLSPGQGQQGLALPGLLPLGERVSARFAPRPAHTCGGFSSLPPSHLSQQPSLWRRTKGGKGERLPWGTPSQDSIALRRAHVELL